MTSKETIKEIIKNKRIDSNVLSRDIEIVNINKIYTIIGPRRAGKTFFLYQIINKLKEEIDESQIVYINFEDERLIDLQVNDLQKIIDAYFELHQKNKNKKIYFFFDEIQNVFKWSKFIRRVYDSEKCEIYITGSSSKLLSSEIATELRGRTYDYFVYTFSFFEYLNKKNIYLTEDMVYGKEKYKIIKEFKEYLKYGGFPEIVNLNESIKFEILQTYFDVLIYRDIIERYNVKQTHIIKEMLLYLTNNFSRTFTVNAYYRYLLSKGIKVSKDTIYSYQTYIENTLYFYFVPIYCESIKKQNSNGKKVYVIDNGLINCVSTKINENEGWLYENLVFVSLLRKQNKIYYYKGKNECDFIAIDKKNKKIAIQVCVNEKVQEKEREINGLKEAMTKHKINKGIIITKDVYEKNGNIEYIPLWRWLLKDLKEKKNIRLKERKVIYNVK